MNAIPNALVSMHVICSEYAKAAERDLEPAEVEVFAGWVSNRIGLLHQHSSLVSELPYGSVVYYQSGFVAEGQDVRQALNNAITAASGNTPLCPPDDG